MAKGIVLPEAKQNNTDTPNKEISEIPNICKEY
jgi:hypothetical protein